MMVRFYNGGDPKLRPKTDEGVFKRKLVRDLEKEKVRVLNLGSGTFDLFVDERKRFFIELKMVTPGYGVPFQTRKGINLSPQTEAIRKMKNLPMILAYDPEEDIYYLITPEEFREFVDERDNEPNILIGARFISKRNTYNYSSMLKKLLAYIRD
jgi:hypothetical protein